MTPREMAMDLMRRGLSVLPLRGDKSPVTHLVPDGYLNASDDPAKLWWFSHDDTEMVGIVPGSAGLIVLDVDVKRGIDGYANLRDLGEAAGMSPGKMWWEHVVTTPSGGAHIYLQKRDAHEHIGNHDLCRGVNVRSDAGYVPAPGSPGYAFPLNQEPDGFWQGFVTAPQWVMERLREAAAAETAAALEEPYSAPEARMEPMVEWDDKVMEAINSFQPNGDRHTSMLGAVAALCNYELLGYAGATRALMMLEARFASAIADRASDREARQEFRRAVWGARTKVRATSSIGLEEREKDRAFIEQIILEHGGDEKDVERVVAIEQAPARLRVWSMKELMESDLSLNWLVRNILVSPTYGQIAGEKKTLKTYLAQYLAVAIASGEPFMGQFPVERQGNVVMFVGEGGRIPWTRRMPRIAHSVGISDVGQVPIHAVFQTAPLLSPAFKATVEASLDALDPVLTIIDPFYAFHGSDTNSANIHEEGALLTAAAAPFIDHGSTLLIVNHFKKGAESRGLNRITMAGSGEWVDSWFFTAERAPANLNTGDFFIEMEAGSRQWGGSRWEMDFNIGEQSPMGEESQTPITFEIRRSYS